jgi:Protein of unknown function (DUF4233)
VRSPMRTLAATMLALEALVVFFAALVAKNFSGLSVASAVGGGAVLAVLCLVAAGLLRSRVGYLLGWLLQLVMILTGTVVPMMFGIGLLFAALWVVALVVGAKVEREQAYVASRLAEREVRDGPEADRPA